MEPVKDAFVMLLSMDGGDTWQRQTLNATNKIGESAFAASNSSLLVTHPAYRRFCTGGTGGPRVIRLGGISSDQDQHPPSKQTWEASFSFERLQSLSQFPSSGCFSMAEDPHGATVAVGGDYMKPNDRNNTAWTSSLSLFNSYSPETFEFHVAQIPPHGYRSAVAFDSKTKTWITVGPNGTDISSDDGKNWRALKPSQGEAPNTDQNWNALSLPFVVGLKGRIGKLNPTTLK